MVHSTTDDMKDLKSSVVKLFVTTALSILGTLTS